MVFGANLVESTIDMISMAFQKIKVVLKADNLPSIYGDEKMLRRVFMNLISNAFKFTKYRETAVIEVGALEEPREIVYYVRDNGEGFDMRHKDNLFKVFGRFHNTDKFEGAGIGLAIVKRIAEEHGGRVWAESGIGEGATFFLALPRTLGAKG
jgi:light-regulated signal transduction histidine kinase (bacteriophytochrome)